MNHLEVRMARDLAALRAQVSAQAAKVEQAIRQAVRALQTGNQDLAQATILADHGVNRGMREIDRLCHGFIAVHLPSAGILRLLSSVIRVNIELERIGDYAVTISREAVQLSQVPDGHLAREIDWVAGTTLLMLRQSIAAFNEQHGDLARGTLGMAGQIATHLDGVYELLMDNPESLSIRDLLAVFVTFNLLKRVADQSKNICEETLFSALGELKTRKPVRILFLDQDDSLLGPLAVAIGRVNFPASGRYQSAGRQPAAAVNPRLLNFMQSRGLDLAAAAPVGLTSLTRADLGDQKLVVSLQGPVRSYIPRLPFHTAALEWNLAEVPAEPDDAQLENLYRHLALLIQDLMHLLRGPDAQ